MQKIRVDLGDRGYDIEIASKNLLHTDFSRFGNRFAILTDRTVDRLYCRDLMKGLQDRGMSCECFIIPPGEKSKTLENAVNLGSALIKKGFDRNSFILALGGGVVGDLAGYVASFFMRGIDYVQIPTTLLAQVDSSVGGKTGVDIPEGKNLFGSLYQPKGVIIDVNVLKTLPEKEVKNGLAEVIKYGMINDAELFAFLEDNYAARDTDFFISLVHKSCEIKGKIVEEDEFERGLRKILNYGHTIGHAIETAERYSIPHGEAVALGMVYEGRISNKLGLLDTASLERQNELIRKMGLPTGYMGCPDDLIEIMRVDKKSKDGCLYFILPKSVGNVKQEGNQFAFPVEETLVRECLEEPEHP